MGNERIRSEGGGGRRRGVVGVGRLLKVRLGEEGGEGRGG